MTKTSGFHLNLSALENTPANREELKKIIDQMEEISALKRELGIAGQTVYHGVSAEELKSRLAAFETEVKKEEAAAERSDQMQMEGGEKIRALTEEVAYLKGQLDGMKKAASQPGSADSTAIETILTAVSGDMDELKRSVAALQQEQSVGREKRDSELVQRILRSIGDDGEDGAFAGVSFTAVEYLRSDTTDRLSALLREVEKVLRKAARYAEDGKIRASRALVAGLKRHLRPVMLTGSRAVAQLRKMGEDLLISTEDLLRVEEVFATFEELGKNYGEQDLTAVIREKIVTFGDETLLASDHEVCAILAARAYDQNASDGEIEALKAELTSFPLSAALRFDVENVRTSKPVATPEPAPAWSEQAEEEIRALKAEIADLRQNVQKGQAPEKTEETPVVDAATAEELRALKEEIANLRKRLETPSVPDGETAERAQGETDVLSEDAERWEQDARQGDEPVRKGDLYYFEDEEDFVTEVPEAEEDDFVDPAALRAETDHAESGEEKDLLSALPRKKRPARPRKTVEVRPIARQKAPFKTKQVRITATSAISEELQKKMDEMDG